MRSFRAVRAALGFGLAAALLPAGPVVPAAAGAADGALPAAVTVSAGRFDRRDTVVTFDLPAVPRVQFATLAGEDDGSPLPLQIEKSAGGARGVFLLPDLKAGQTRTYRVVTSRGGIQPQAPRVTAKREGGVIDVAADGKPVLRYQGEKGALPEGFPPEFQRGGYISAVYTPQGRLVTDDYPPNHKHHHGIWSPWTKTEFEGRHPDFWNMGDKTGTVEFAGFGDLFEGLVAGGFGARHRFVDLSAGPEPKAALNEQWAVRAYDPAGAYHLFDWQSTQTCASDSPLALPEYHYGGLGFRGNRAWDGKDNLTFFTSEGKEGRTANGSRARWAYVGGQVEGHPAGVAILCSPDDFRFPQPVRIHPTEPFFCYAPQQLGGFRIEPGKPYVAKYRFAVLDGEPDGAMKGEIERLWNDYAEPPKVGVK